MKDMEQKPLSSPGVCSSSFSPTETHFEYSLRAARHRPLCGSSIPTRVSSLAFHKPSVRRGSLAPLVVPEVRQTARGNSGAMQFLVVLLQQEHMSRMHYLKRADRPRD